MVKRLKKVIEVAFLTSVYIGMVCIIIIEGFYPGIME
jgi:hypothetical protein